mmetsp:Transcript_3581/g.5570  ORF Transcript_3581/g.5570 Transcript_3581/m.5570 type:complete len:1660 (+) Transcript_3581:100-5079(+)
MNFLHNPISDALQVWDSVKDSVKDRLTKRRSKGNVNLDFSFITPTLLAVGKINESKVDELIHTLQGQPALLWNISGKEFSSEVSSKLNYQVIDNPWVTPGHFTQLPSLDCVFRQCYSIKAWLDLSSENVAILHCSNGRLRTGILMACFLKYIGAFEYSLDAFDFFYGARVRADETPTLPPSYRILFENVDRSTDHGGSPNPFPLHLECLVISGLPVDDLPCVEIWDMSGLVFNSHNGMAHSASRCTWSSEFADGCFKISADIVGDFSVMCRFGGPHALTRNKTTLIFKYQNSTAFLPPDVVELCKQNVDINPEYADFLDDTMFSVHLKFNCADERALQKIENKEFANSYQLRGIEAFESGLDEISKYHLVEPDAQLCCQLAESGFPSEYIAVALQLANKDMDTAIRVMELLVERSRELRDQKSVRPALPASPYDVKLSKVSLGVARSGEKARRTMTLQTESAAMKLFTENDDKKQRERSSSSRKSSSERRSRRERSHRSSSSKDSDATSRGQSPTPSEGSHSSDSAVTCAICNDDSYTKRDQLVPCAECKRLYHTQCFGARRIPFTIKSVKERTNRDKYIAKHYSSWACPNCAQKTGSGTGSPPVGMRKSSKGVGGNPQAPEGGVWVSAEQAAALSQAQGTGALSSTSNSRPQIVSEGSTSDSVEEGSSNSKADSWAPSFRPSGKVAFKQKAENPISRTSSGDGSSGQLSLSNHNDVAKLMGILASSGISLDELLNMSEQQQRETLLLATTRHQNKSSPRNSARTSDENSEFHEVSAGETKNTSPTASGPSSQSQSPSTSPRGTKPGPADAQFAAKIQGIEQQMQEYQRQSSSQESKPVDSGSTGITPEILTDISKMGPKYKKYLKMCQVGLPLKTVEDRMVTDGLDIDALIKQCTSGASAPSPPSGETVANPTSSQVDDGSKGGMVSKAPSNQEESSSTGSMGVVALDDPRYIKYVNMITVGLPKSAVSNKMVTDGMAPSAEVALAILEQRPVDLSALPKHKQESPKKQNETTPPQDSVKEEAKKSDDSKSSEDKPVKDGENKEGVTFDEHPTYSKFFRMLKAGIPAPAIKQKMELAGLDSSVLDKDPKDIAPGEPVMKTSNLKVATEEKDVEMVALQDHPVYSKYFRMMKVGLPVEAVRAKMKLENIDDSVLDKSPTDMVPVQIESDKKDDPGEMVPLQDHPAYGKYLRMLKVGLPLAAAKQKMQDEGFDPNILDNKLTDLVPLDTNYRPARAAEKKRSPSSRVRKKKLHWKALDKSRVGADSLWASDDDDDNFKLDPEEFNQLFVQKESKKSATGNITSKLDTKKKVVNLIDMKRGQNAGIALARLKMPFKDVRKRIERMDEKAFTTDQYESLQEYLPTVEERGILKRYVGDVDHLGLAERYMLEMLDCENAAKKIKCIIYKQQFRGRLTEITNCISKVENACDDVKLSVKLKKVLKTILKVGNQMNDGEAHAGFTVDSLLKLQNAKAFDKKTSILQYVIRLIHRNDETCLQFPDDLVHLVDADRLSVDHIVSEYNSLCQSQSSCKAIVDDISAGNGSESVASMEQFLTASQRLIDDVNSSIQTMREKYQSVLAYFGEEANMQSQEFFSTLEKFVRAFEEEREAVERQRRAEEKSAQAKHRKTLNSGNATDAGSKDQKAGDTSLPLKMSRRASAYL